MNKTTDGRAIWKISLDKNADDWNDCKSKKYIFVRWEWLGDFRTYATEEGLLNAFGASPKAKNVQDAKSIWYFTHDIARDDIIIATKEQSSILGIGLITGDYLPLGQGRSPGLPWHNSRRVEWIITEELDITPIKLSTLKIAPISIDQWQLIKQAYLRKKPSLAQALAKVEEKGLITVLPEPSLFLKETLQKSRNIILYGPPGTGKTFHARNFAKVWTQDQISNKVIDRNYWCVIANPTEWHWDSLFEEGVVGYSEGKIKRNYEIIKPGDLVVGYLSSPTRQIYCIAQVVPKPNNTKDEWPFYLQGLRKLDKPIPLQNMRDDPILANSEPIQQNMQGTLFHFTSTEADQLRKLIERENPDIARILESYEQPAYVRTITFHQSYGYEDFIEGLRPTLDPHKGIQYEWRPGIFKQMCKDASADPDNNFILIIDEINRGNIAKIFGELITLLEDDKRQGRDQEMSVILPGSQEHFVVPSNLYIIGTMNTADRSIALLDIALRRRFTFVEMRPEPALLANKNIEGIPLDKLLSRLNARIEALLDPDHNLGHSYFWNIQNLEELHFIWYQKIIPLLQEYFYNDG